MQSADAFSRIFRSAGRYLGTDHRQRYMIGVLFGTVFYGFAEYFAKLFPDARMIVAVQEVPWPVFVAVGVLVALTPLAWKARIIPEAHVRVFDLIDEAVSRGRISKPRASMAYEAVINKTLEAFHPVIGEPRDFDAIGEETLEEAQEHDRQ